MERVVADMLRFDCYGKLLTARQQRLYRLYYCEDYSLAEIAAALRITRQAVSDLLRRTRAHLRRYDAALGLVAAARRRQAAQRELARLLAELPGRAAARRALACLMAAE